MDQNIPFPPRKSLLETQGNTEGLGRAVSTRVFHGTSPPGFSACCQARLVDRGGVQLSLLCGLEP